MQTMHIVAGLLALLTGALALYATKGSEAHRASGQLFVGTMVLMTSSALIMAVFVHLNRLNVVAATLTLYLVASGWLAVARPLQRSRGWVGALMLGGFAVSGMAGLWSVQAFRSPGGSIDGMLPQPIVAFGIIALIGALADARLLYRGTLAGTQRIVRHLWRINTAMLIATVSFFLGQGKFFPQPLRDSLGLRAIPVLLVLGVMFYWLIRLLLFKRPPVRPRPRASKRTTPAPAALGNPG